MKIERKMFNTTLRPDLIRELKFLGVKLDKPLNALLEEAIADLLAKHSVPDDSRNK